MTTTAWALLAAAIALALLGALAFAALLARRREEERTSRALAGLAATIDRLSAELEAALGRVQRKERVVRALGDDADWLDAAGAVSRVAEAAAHLGKADASLVRARDGSGVPLVATVGLSHDVDPGTLGWPPGGTRAVALDFLGADAGGVGFRSGMAVPIDAESDPPSFLAVYWQAIREPGETVVGDLEALATRVRPLLNRVASAPANGTPAAVDELTTLAGRLAFQDALAREVTRARLRDGRFALLLLDVDDFGVVNERVGYLAGDALLVEVADRLREAAEASGAMGCRIGGDEFAVILPSATLTDAEQTFARLQASLSLPSPQRAYRVTVSGGIAALENDEDPLDVYERAEQALSQAKDIARGSAVVAAANGGKPA